MRLCKNTSVAFSPGDSMDVLAEKIITAADDDKDGVIQPVELERAIRGWIKVDYSKIADSKEKGRENELKGAAARAEIARKQGGGFAGLTDAEEALTIGKDAQERTGAEKAVFMESEPTVFAGGAHYQLAGGATKRPFLCTNDRFHVWPTSRSPPFSERLLTEPEMVFVHRSSSHPDHRTQTKRRWNEVCDGQSQKEA